MPPNGPPRLLQVSTVAVTLRSFLLPFARHFRALGWTVDGMARDATGDEVCRASFDRVWDMPWSRNPAAIARPMELIHRVQALVRENAYDIVHVHTPIAAFLTRYALRGSRRCACVYTVHGFHFHPRGTFIANRLFAAAERMAGAWTDALVVINEEDERAALRHRIVPRERLHHIPGIGVDTNVPRATPEQLAALRSEIGIPPDAPVFLMVAEFNPGKRHRDAIAAFARMGGRRAHLVFAGDGKTSSTCREQSRRLGVAGRVHFLGHRRDVGALLQAATASLLPSEREGLPRSILEAMASGTPVIGSDIRGIRDLLSDGAGLLVPVGGVATLASALDWATENEGELKRLAAVARQRVLGFSTERILQSYAALYDAMLRRA